MDLIFCVGRGRERPVQAAFPDTEAGPNPDHAWKTLSLVNEWIRHSDAKAGVTLAFTGVLATVTFNLTKDLSHRTILVDILVVVAGALLVMTGALCGWTLTPRVHAKSAEPATVSRLFFASISESFTRRQYGTALTALTADMDALTRDLANQIHANAHIATVKARSIKWAIRSALLAGAIVAAIATSIGITNL